MPRASRRSINELSRALYGEDETTPNEIRTWLEVPDLLMLVGAARGRPDRGVRGHGRPAQEHRRFSIDLRVPPAAHGSEIGAELLSAMEVFAAELATRDASVRVFVPSTHEHAVRLVEDRGYELFRHSFQMRIDLDREVPEPDWPENISVRTFEPGQDEEAVYETQQDAFADHFESARWPYESWCRWSFTESFDPSLWLIAEDGPEIAGVCLCRSESGASGELGWVNCSACGAGGVVVGSDAHSCYVLSPSFASAERRALGSASTASI